MGNFSNELKKDFQIIPNDLIFDNRLTDRARFVYCYMAAKPENWDFYLQPMAKEIGYSVDTLRKYIGELVKSGWLEKGEQNHLEGNRFGATEYTLKAKLPIRKNTDTENFGDGKSSTQYNTDSINKTDNRDKTDKGIKNKKKFDFRSAILSLGVEENICEDWLQVRKTKRASNTETAFNRIKSEIMLSGMSANDCIRIAAENSWQGFKTEWLTNNRSNNGQTTNNRSNEPTKQDRDEEYARIMAGLNAKRIASLDERRKDR